MRRIVIGSAVVLLSLQLIGVVSAEDKSSTTERVMGGVISGLLGQPAQPADAAYAAKERERLVSLLQSGSYVTSRQGEPMDTVILGVPLTRTEHVYTAKPAQPSPASSQ